MSKDAFLTVLQVAKLLGLHPESVRKMVRDGRLPAFKAGRSWRFDPEDLQAWRRAQRGAAQRVLVVDDAPHVRDVIRLTLEDDGYRVVQAGSGRDAVEALEAALPDLILLDLKLPEGSGVEVLQQVRRRSTNLPVIVITGYPDSELMHRAMAHAPFVVLAKPVAPDLLLETVHQALGQPVGDRRPPQAAPPPQSTVLVVDDDPMVCQAIARQVSRLGHATVQAHSGQRALELLAENAPDLLLLDLVMPGMNGPELLRALCDDHPLLPVVIVTGFPDSQLMSQAMQYPPVMLLAKPIEREALDRTLRAMLGARELPLQPAKSGVA